MDEKYSVVPLKPANEENKRQTSALTGFLLSIFSVVYSGTIVGLILAIMGLSFSAKGSKVNSPNHKAYSNVGKTLSIVQIVIFVIVVLLIVSVIVLSIALVIFYFLFYFLFVLGMLPYLSQVAQQITTAISLLF